MSKMSIDKSTFELLVLAAYAHDEISIGRAIELLHVPDDKIKEMVAKRVNKIKEMVAKSVSNQIPGFPLETKT